MTIDSNDVEHILSKYEAELVEQVQAVVTGYARGALKQRQEAVVEIRKRLRALVSEGGKGG
jgi:pyridoxal/pyridoxine/pyridoxamine kinase